jgi:hypothetical protein
LTDWQLTDWQIDSLTVFLGCDGKQNEHYLYLVLRAEYEVSATTAPEETPRTATTTTTDPTDQQQQQPLTDMDENISLCKQRGIILHRQKFTMDVLDLSIMVHSVSN